MKRSVFEEENRRRHIVLRNHHVLWWCQNSTRRVSVRHPRRRYILSCPASHAGVDPVSPLHVFVVIRPVSEMMLALVTGIGPFARMLSPVRGQDAFKSERLAAKLAGKRHGSSVNAMVLLQRPPFPKLSPTHVTLVWLQSRMHGVVLLQSNQRFEGLATNCTVKWPGCSVGQQVVL